MSSSQPPLDGTPFPKGPVPCDHLPLLDGLRAVAVGAVLLAHWPQGLSTPGLLAWITANEPGYFGVELFFVLSGFLITRILLAGFRQGESLAGFYLRRGFRILPPYALLLTVVALVDPKQPLLVYWLYVANFAGIESPQATYLNPLWSLSIEEQFYLLWPVALGWLWRRRLTIWILPAAYLLFAAAVAHYLDRFGEDAGRLLGAIYLSTATRAPALLAGAVLAINEPQLRVTQGATPRSMLSWLVPVAAFAALTSWGPLRALGLFDYVRQASWITPAQAQPIVHALHMTGVALLVLLAVICLQDLGGVARWLKAPLASTPLVLIGQRSYGIYLYHMPLIAAIGWPNLKEQNRAGVLYSLAYFVLLALAAGLSYRFLERPLIALGRRYSNAQKHPRSKSVGAQ